MATGFWNLQSDRAALACGALEATLDLRLPARGLHDLRVLGRPVVGASLLGVELPGDVTASGAVVDAHVRSADLVAGYAPSRDWPYGAQIYWRVWVPKQAAVLAAVELIVSVQTNLLDSHPRLMARSEFPECDLLRLSQPERGAFVAVPPTAWSPSDNSAGATAASSSAAALAPAALMLRPRDEAWTYGEFVHPTGPEQTELRPAPAPAAVRLGHWLFAERLEKGVILRARVLGGLVDRGQERLQLAALYREFAASPPPLTV